MGKKRHLFHNLMQSWLKAFAPGRLLDNRHLRLWCKSNGSALETNERQSPLDTPLLFLAVSDFCFRWKAQMWLGSGALDCLLKVSQMLLVHWSTWGYFCPNVFTALDPHQFFFMAWPVAPCSIKHLGGLLKYVLLLHRLPCPGPMINFTGWQMPLWKMLMDLADLMVWSKQRWAEMSDGVSGQGLTGWLDGPRASSCCMGSALLTPARPLAPIVMGHKKTLAIKRLELLEKDEIFQLVV